GLGRERAEGTQRFQRRQRQTGAQTSEKTTTAQTRKPLDGDVLREGLFRFHGLTFNSARSCKGFGTSGPAGTLRFRRFWKGADSMTPISRVEKRPFSFSRLATIWSTVSTS